MSGDDQQKATSKPQNKEFKIVASTNIAESSLTIDNAVIALDTGLERIPNYKKELILHHVSKSSAIQRAGRVGRTMPGICIRLFDFEYIGNEFRHQTKLPQILNSPLEDFLLTVKRISNTPRNFIKSMPDPPKDDLLDVAMHSLYLRNIMESEYIVDGLTPLGRMGILFCDSHEHFHFVFNCFVGKQVIPGLVLLCAFDTQLFNFKFHTDSVNQVAKFGNFLKLYLADDADHGYSDLNVMLKFLFRLLSGTINVEVLDFLNIQSLKFFCDTLIRKINQIIKWKQQVDDSLFI
ncbi:hypothetical protein GEMRC1_012954 [Eukaryota sp. GEM-RC1]